MTVRDFCAMCTDDSSHVIIWDVGEEVNVFCGTMREAMESAFANYDVETFDTMDERICLNIIID